MPALEMPPSPESSRPAWSHRSAKKIQQEGASIFKASEMPPLGQPFQFQLLSVCVPENCYFGGKSTQEPFTMQIVTSSDNSVATFQHSKQ